MGTNKTRVKGRNIKKLPIGGKVATPTVPGFRARGIITSHTARCLPLTGTEENATMLVPTLRENLLFPSSSPSAMLTKRFPQVQSMVAYGANYLRIYKVIILYKKRLFALSYCTLISCSAAVSPSMLSGW